MNLDWHFKGAVKINHDALLRIIGVIVSLMASQAHALRLPLPVYRLVMRVVFPAESAVRRLLVIAARGLVVKDVATRPMPKGMVIAAKGTGPMVFSLIDRRKTFGDPDEPIDPRSGPRIRTVDGASPREMFLATFKKPPDDTCTESETTTLRRRLDCLKKVLDNLPHHTTRMARWLKKRRAMTTPAIRYPMRPGFAPGRVKRSKEEIQHILSECHAIAWDSFRTDSS